MTEAQKEAQRLIQGHLPYANMSVPIKDWMLDEKYQEALNRTKLRNATKSAIFTVKEKIKSFDAIQIDDAIKGTAFLLEVLAELESRLK